MIDQLSIDFILQLVIWLFVILRVCQLLYILAFEDAMFFIDVPICYCLPEGPYEPRIRKGKKFWKLLLLALVTFRLLFYTSSGG